MGLIKTAAARRYRRRMSIVMSAYVALVVAISWVWPIEGLPDGWRHAAALLPVIPIAGVIWLMARYLQEEEDEFLRLLQARAMLVGTGLLLAAGTAWGFLQEYTGIAPFPIILLFPAWCTLFGLASAWNNWRHR
jgi:hypothetical protein